MSHNSLCFTIAFLESKMHFLVVMGTKLRFSEWRASQPQMSPITSGAKRSSLGSAQVPSPSPRLSDPGSRIAYSRKRSSDFNSKHIELSWVPMNPQQPRRRRMRTQALFTARHLKPTQRRPFQRPSQYPPSCHQAWSHPHSSPEVLLLVSSRASLPCLPSPGFLSPQGQS